jgi:5'-deoxynucleotidase YfbR-like HD superfamily hydrolase
MKPIHTFSQRIEFMQRGRATRRFHTVPVHEAQRVDAHSAGVALVALMLMGEVSADRKARVLSAALTHDLGEHRVGDLPAPAKRALGKEWSQRFSLFEHSLLQEHGFMSDLDPADVRVLKLADYIDGCLFCIDERMMGNKGIAEVFDNFWSYLYNDLLLGKHPIMSEAFEIEFASYLERRWNIACVQNGA